MDPIVTVEAIELSVPFDDGSGFGPKPGRWSAFDMVLVRIETRAGRVGWGEAFSYGCRTAVAAAVRDMVAPLVIGSDAENVENICDTLQQRLHIFGRYGVTVFAISGVDVALWDLAAQKAGVPLHRLLGKTYRTDVHAYASMVRYGDPALVERIAGEAVAQGYRSVKLHEIDIAAIQAGRIGSGRNVHLTVDVNCAWTSAKAVESMPLLREAAVDWLEEPIFPPEDYTALAALRGRNVKIAAGENFCTSIAFRQALDAGALDVAQPSVTKVGGITEFLRTSRLCMDRGLSVMPHSPYFGPGYWATLHLCATLPQEPMFEVLYVRPEAEFGIDRPKPVEGRVLLSGEPGLGFRPDPTVLQRYSVSSQTSR